MRPAPFRDSRTSQCDRASPGRPTRADADARPGNLVPARFGGRRIPNHQGLSTVSMGYPPTRPLGWRTYSDKLPAFALGPHATARGGQGAGSTTVPSARGGQLGCPSPGRRHVGSGAAVPSSCIPMGARKRRAHAAVSHPIKDAPPKCDAGVLRDGLPGHDMYAGRIATLTTARLRSRVRIPSLPCRLLGC
jgi:hypothetical protein